MQSGGLEGVKVWEVASKRQPHRLKRPLFWEITLFMASIPLGTSRNQLHFYYSSALVYVNKELIVGKLVYLW